MFIHQLTIIGPLQTGEIKARPWVPRLGGWSDHFRAKQPFTDLRVTRLVRLGQNKRVMAQVGPWLTQREQMGTEVHGEVFLYQRQPTYLILPPGATTHSHFSAEVSNRPA